MNTVLRVLVVVILVLSAAALALAIGLFGKRELLIGRTHLLETQLIRIAKTIEQTDPAEPVRPPTTARDTSPVTSKELDNPERSAFWDSYLFKLETPNLPVIDLDNEQKKLQLRQYYRMVDGKKAIDPLTNKPSTSGPGTMQELLDLVLTRATIQNATLNKTRVELTKVRTELDDTIKDLNDVKRNGRTDKRIIEDKQKEIETLKDEKLALERKIKGLEEEKVALTAELAESKNEITKQKEEIADLAKQVKDLNQRVKDLIGKAGIPKSGDSAVRVGDIFQGKLSPGDKGRIVASDDKLKFVVAELSDAFMAEILGPNRDGALPQLELMVRRPGLKSPSGEFVTRIKLRQILRQQNLVVADVLIDWQQMPVDKNDVVFF